MGKDKKPIFNVTSSHQSGGITAGQVNIGPQPRKIDDNVRHQLRELVKARPGAPISVTAVMGDGEAYGFAEQIKNFLESEGLTVDGINQAVYSGRIVGQEVNPDQNKLDIRVGHIQ